MAEEFDPRQVLAALERNRVPYVLIGGLARVIRGADELTDGVDVCPAVRQPENVERLGRALDELGVTRADGQPLTLDSDELAREPVLALRTNAGLVNVVVEPAGTRRGFDDLRRGASREHIGHGLRPQVASVPDLARMAAAMGREHDLNRSRELRRIMELEFSLQGTLGLDPGIEH